MAWTWAIQRSVRRQGLPGKRDFALVVVLLAAHSVPLYAQIERFQPLAPIAGAAGRCYTTAARNAVAGEHANRTVTLRLDGAPQRELSVTTNGRGGIGQFSTSVDALLDASRHAGERVTAQYDPNGQLIRGERLYLATEPSGAGAREKSQPITKDDAADALQLAKRVLERCVRLGYSEKRAARHYPPQHA